MKTEREEQDHPVATQRKTRLNKKNDNNKKESGRQARANCGTGCNQVRSKFKLEAQLDRRRCCAMGSAPMAADCNGTWKTMTRISEIKRERTRGRGGGGGGGKKNRLGTFFSLVLFLLLFF